MSNRGWTILSVAVVVILLLSGFWYFTSTPNSNGFEAGVGGGPETNNTVRDINTSPDNYYGTSVEVMGEIDTVYTRRIFRLDQMGTVAGDEILVISRSPLSDDSMNAVNDPTNNADQIIVTGTVRKMVIGEIERDYNITLDPQIQADFQNKPIITASEIQIRNPQ